MKRVSIVFLKTTIVLFGISILAFMLWEPHLEGRNVNATLFEIYFNDLFLAYAYIASIPFFMALYHAFKVVGWIGQKNKGFAQAMVKSLRTIKYCAMAMTGFAIGGEVFILFGESDDRAGGVFMGLLIIFSSILMALAATRFERVLKNAVKD